MFIDGRNIPRNTVVDTDLAIIGAGAAGITLAKEFSNSATRVCLIESGGLEPDPDTQALYQGEITGLSYPLGSSRLRYFGGSTNHWGGWCRPLDAIDFERRAWVPNSGWPISRNDLDRFYIRAQKLCETGPFKYDAMEYWSEKVGFEPMPFPGGAVDTRFFQFSTPTRFGKKYHKEIEGSINIKTLLHSNVVEIEESRHTSDISRLHVATLQGSKFFVKASVYILATGGIENPRLLLVSNRVNSAGLGNGNDLVGRFFMEHPIIPELAKGVLLDLEVMPGIYRKSVRLEGTRVRPCLMPSENFMRKKKLLNSLISFVPTKEYSAEGGIVLRFLEDPQDKDPNQAWEIALLNNMASHTTSFRKSEQDPFKAARLSFGGNCEQAPNPESRITLSDQQDALGLRRTRLDWRLSTEDKQSFRSNVIAIAASFGARGDSRVKSLLSDNDVWPEINMWGNHHMGTTRMGDTEQNGVVDRNCQVFGLKNLYIAGSSVFTTSGAANPTLTLVALAVRLADHIKSLKN